MTNLQQRIVSAAILAPIVLGIIYIGGIALVALIIAAYLIMLWEWCRMTKGIMWWLMGFLYLTPPCLTLGFFAVMPLIGQQPEKSPIDNTVFFVLFILVWAIDIGAYIAGKTIGGPKIAPRISPKKTWAGLSGGICCAIFVLFMYGNLYDFEPTKTILASIVLGNIAAIVAQAGDFFESWVKRKFGVKDSSNIIPGHGGLLDRLDGLLGLLWAILILFVWYGLTQFSIVRAVS